MEITREATSEQVIYGAILPVTVVMKDLIIPVLIREVKIWQYTLFFFFSRLAKFGLRQDHLFFFLNKSALLFIDVYVYIAVL